MKTHADDARFYMLEGISFTTEPSKRRKSGVNRAVIMHLELNEIGNPDAKQRALKESLNLTEVDFYGKI